MTITDLPSFTLGGSDVPAVLGLDPYLSSYALGCRKLGITDDKPMSEAMRTGLRLQVAHAQMVEDDGYQIIEAPAAGFTHPELPWLVGHPDFFVSLDGQRAPLELKLRGIAPSDALKLRDTVQALVYCELVASAAALVSTLHGGYGGVTRSEWVVEHDADLWADIVERCEAFLALLRRGKLPAPDGSDSTREALRARYGDAQPGKTVRLTQEQWKHLLRIRELDEVIARAKDQRERHAQIVQDAMADATEAISPYDTEAARWRPVHSTRLDTRALRAAHPDIAAEFSKTTTSRRFEANP